MTVNFFTHKVITALFCFSLTYVWSISAKSTVFNSHSHGLSEVNIVIEKKNIVIEMISPASDLVGFEHKAETEQSINKVKMVEKQLNKHHEVFSFSGGGCQLISKVIDVSSLTNIVHAHQEHQEDKVQSNKKNSHSEIFTNYEYYCEKIPELSSITVKLFYLFTSVHEVQAVWIREAQQGATMLNSKNNVINLR